MKKRIRHKLFKKHWRLAFFYTEERVQTLKGRWVNVLHTREFRKKRRELANMFSLIPASLSRKSGLYSKMLVAYKQVL